MDALSRRWPGLRSFPHIDLGVRPTPVETRRIGGLTVLVKRDDLTTAECGGNKPRSLEFLLALPARRVLTYSTLSAHHALATARCAARLGLACDLVIVRRGRPGPALDAARAAAGRLVETRSAAGALLATARLWRPGTRIIPPGGMSPRGALGYLVAALELDEVPGRIYCPLGSGTTVSGLLAGLMLRGAKTEVVGVRVADAIAGLRPLLWRRAFRAIALLRRHAPEVPRPRRGGVRLRVVAGGGAYGEETPAARAAMEAAGGLSLEPAYTAKTLARLLADRAGGALFILTYGPVRAPRARSS